jgi:hypothetical protein
LKGTEFEPMTEFETSDLLIANPGSMRFQGAGKAFITRREGFRRGTDILPQHPKMEKKRLC